MRHCTICGKQFENNTAYRATCSDTCDGIFDQEGKAAIRRMFSEVAPEAARVLGFQTVEDVMLWLTDLRREDTTPGGEVYFLACGDFVKIGYSTDIAGRTEALQPGAPQKLELIGRMPGSIQTERALHKKFKHLREHGEWFSLTDDIWKFLKAVRNKRQ